MRSTLSGERGDSGMPELMLGEGTAGRLANRAAGEEKEEEAEDWGGVRVRVRVFINVTERSVCYSMVC